MAVRRGISIAALAVIVASAACTSHSNAPLVPSSSEGSALSLPGAYIKHVVVIVQENRSFENIFAGWPKADAPMYGYKSDGSRVKLHQMRYADDCYTIMSFSGCDIGHLWEQALQDYHGGKMDGYNLEGLGTTGYGPPAGDVPYAYLDHGETAPYRQLASGYTLVDHMFPTEFGTSFTAHQDLIAGTTQIAPGESLVNIPLPGPPWGCEAPDGTFTSLVNTQRQITNNGPFPCLDQYPTIAQRLDAAHVSWKYYAPSTGVFAGQVWSAFSAIRSVYYGPDWKKVISPETIALTDPHNGALPQVSWVIPDLNWSDHAVTTSNLGPSWVGDLVDAIGESQYWKSTAIIVIWDDWGGWYDNAKPPQLDYVGLGERVPCIIISPYARKGYVSHEQYEFGSILKFIEETFGLASLGTTDVRASSLSDSLDFTQAPRPFVAPIITRYPASYFIRQPQSRKAPDDD
jgi:phospholipase C